MRELHELLLDPVQPSEVVRRGQALVRGGEDPLEVARTQATFAAVGAAAGEADSGPAVRGRILASLDRSARIGRFGLYADHLARLFELDIAAAEELARKIGDASQYHRFFVDGVDILPVETGPSLAGAVAVIARLQPGVTFPEHVHGGDERMLVLEGGFRETLLDVARGSESGREFWRGDEVESTSGSGHFFTALPGVPCITASLVRGVIDWK